MTDHLESYRDIARSIQSLPPNSLTHLSQESVNQLLTSTLGVTALSKHTTTEAEVSLDQGTSIDPFEHVAALVHEAVRKPTVLPDTYAIVEDIGDRISRMTAPKPVESKIVPSEIPQPGSQATSAPVSPNLGLPIDPSERNAILVREAVRKPTVLPTPYSILENIGDRINRLATPKPVDSQLIQPKFPQPTSNGISAPLRPALESPIHPTEQAAALEQETLQTPTVLPSTDTTLEDIGDRVSQSTTPKPVDSEFVPPEIPHPDPNSTSTDTIEPQPIEAEIKKSLDDAHPEASVLATVVAEAPLLEETHSNDVVGVVTEPSAVEETTEEPASGEVVAEPVVVEEITHDEGTAAVVDQPAEDEQTLRDEPVSVVEPAADVEQTTDTEALVAQAQEAQAPTLLDRVSSIVEAVSTAFTQPETDQKDSKTEVEPSSSQKAATQESAVDTAEPVTTEAPAAQAQEAQAPTLLDRVSSIVEAVSTALTQPETDQKDSETEVEPSSSQKAATQESAVDTAEPMTTEAPAAQAQEAQAPTLLDRVSSIVEAVSTAFTQPKTDQKDSETEVEPSSSQPTTTEETAVNTVEPMTTEASASDVDNTQASSLLDQVSSVEAVATPLKDSEADIKNSETLVEPLPAAETASDSKTVEITCPECESTEIRKNGRRRGKQRYVCKDCGREFVKPSSVLAEEELNKQASSPVEKAKVKGTRSDTGSGDSSSESSKARSKKKTKSKGFGDSKKAK